MKTHFIISLKLDGNTPNNIFNQDRFFIGTFYHVNKHDNLQIGFTKVYQKWQTKAISSHWT